MSSRSPTYPCICALFLASAFSTAVRADVDDFQMVNLRSFAPTIVIELRYATSENIAHRPIYPSGTQPFLRAGVAKRLLNAQTILKQYGYGLKVWDAFRSREAQAALWKVAPNNDYVANPDANGGSLHSWGIAVDATLVDSWNRPVEMPTDFDDFTPAAMMRYTGIDPNVRTHLAILQSAMGRSGFYGMRTEWWHFTPTDWKRYIPATEAKLHGPAVKLH